MSPGGPKGNSVNVANPVAGAGYGADFLSAFGPGPKNVSGCVETNVVC